MNPVYLLATSTTPFDSVDFSTITTYAEAISGKVGTPLITVLALMIGWRLVKRFGHMIG